jgi:cyanate permease
MPALVERVHARRTVYTVSVIVVGVGLMSIGFLDGDAVIAAVVIMGFALGAGFAMGLALLSEFAHDMHSSARRPPGSR